MEYFKGGGVKGGPWIERAERKKMKPWYPHTVLYCAGVVWKARPSLLHPCGEKGGSTSTVDCKLVDQQHVQNSNPLNHGSSEHLIISLSYQ